jgi:hypothetical protein
LVDFIELLKCKFFYCNFVLHLKVFILTNNSNKKYEIIYPAKIIEFKINHFKDTDVLKNSFIVRMVIFFKPSKQKIIKT